VGVEKRDDGEDAAVVLLCLLEVEFGEDAPYVLLDGTFADKEPVGDPGVGAPLGHEGQHLTLAGGQPGEGIVHALGGDKLVDEPRIDDRTSLDDPPQRVDELVDVGRVSQPGQTVDANSHALTAAAAEAGAHAYRVGICDDDPEGLRGLLEDQTLRADLISFAYSASGR